jgi:uncharacterized protein (UPF0297 family)
MKIANIDNDNKLLGWYDSNIHSVIPTPNVEVTDEQWQVALDNGHNKVNQDGSTEVFDFRSEEEIAEAEANEYKVLRQAEYPSIEDYVDGIVKGDDAQVQEYIDKCLEVKAKYPKPE